MKQKIADESNSLALNSYKRIPAFNMTDLKFKKKEGISDEIRSDSKVLGNTSNPTASTKNNNNS